MPYNKNERTRGGKDGKQGRRDERRRAPLRHANDDAEIKEGAVVGRNAVNELLKSGREIDKIFVQRGEREGSITVIVATAISRKIPVIECEKQKLDEFSGGANHQGVVALASEKEYSSIDDVLQIAKERGEKPFLIIADGIEDPYNLGALIRCADCAGVHGVIIPKRHSATLTPAVSKASAGALEHTAIVKVTNIASTVDELKKAGIWVYAAEVGGKNYFDADYSHDALALVLGSEGEGISRLVLEKCDFRVSIPLYGKVNSLNVSCAAAVVLNEIARQRHNT